MNNKGWIKLHRSIMDSPAYFDEPFTRIQAWIDLLLLAAPAAQTVRIRGTEIQIERGQIAISERSLSDRWEIHRNTVHKYLTEFVKAGQITIQNSYLTTILTIINYNLYQEGSVPLNVPLKSDESVPLNVPLNQLNDNNLTTSDTQESVPLNVPLKTEKSVPHIKNIKNNIKETNINVCKEKEKLEKRKEKFRETLTPYISQYPEQMIEDFFSYWSEMNRSQTLMRFEQQPTWETSRRLAYWARRDKNFKPTIQQHEINRTNTSAQQRRNDAAAIIERLMRENKVE